MIENFAIGFGAILNASTLLIMAAAVAIGIIFGAIPGLSATMAIAIFLPFTFSMPANQGLAMLCALYIGGTSGGLISAILLRMPGTPASVATTFDGYPMAAKGEAGKALGAGIVFSFLGGLFSFIALFFIAPTVARFAVKLGTYEMFSLGIFSLTMICVMTDKDDMSKGIGSGLIGLTLGFVGMAPMDSVKRLTFGIYELDGGFNILSMLIGIFVVSEIIMQSEVRKGAKEGVLQDFKIKGFGFSMQEFVEQLPNALRSALIGLGIGILPGIGGGTSNILAYTVAKGTSKHPELFGTGILDGIVAPETANNATIGGALVPLLTLGIPGDTATAMLIGGFMIHGITPGPMLMVNQKELVYAIFAALLVANFMMLAIEFLGLRVFVRLLKIPKHILMPIILVMCAVGAFCLNNRIFDVKCVAFFGIGGYILTKVKIPLTPIILGFILGTMIETNFRRGLQYAGGSGLPFVTRPMSVLFLLMALLVLVSTLISYKRREKKSAVV